MEDVSLLSDREDSDDQKRSSIGEHAERIFPSHRNGRIGCLLPLASFMAALGGILFGYDIGIISGALLQLREYFHVSCHQQEMIVTSLIIGGLIASLVGGQIVDHFGRRRAIILNSLFFTVGAMVLAFSKAYSTLIIGRLMLGFAVSLSAIGECIYISEIAPPARRGLLVSLNELGIVVGILLAYLVNFLLIQKENGWRIMFGLSAIPALLQGLGMMFLPSSPRWLVSMQNIQEARLVVAKLWPSCDVDHEIQRMKASLKTEKEYKITDLFSKKENMRLRMVIGCGVVFFQQITGQPTVLYYAPAVFQSLGFKSSSSATLATVGLGVVKVVFTTFTLINVDKLGRRLLLLLGVGIMTVSLMTLSCVTISVHDLQTRNPCDKKVIGAGHTYISDPAYDLKNHCHDVKTINSTNTTTLTRDSVKNLSLRSVKSTGIPRPKSKMVKLLNCTMKHKHFSAKESKELHHHSPALKYVCLISLMVFVAGYAIGYGPMSWLILTEIFPVGVKGRAVAAATVFNWGTNILISMTFLEVIGSLGPSITFMIYSILGFFAMIFVYGFVPETKCRSLEQISDELSKRSSFCLGKTHCFQRPSRGHLSIIEDAEQIDTRM
ncbi:solute carrier family 2, facilitated glucose transporter member 12-like [Rhopilema esculentum]|uniref:solute carrier family 2, facilitated glucose transporter member 12-like n=1 Tax=Rhopilema esculentum TaxID=499914 RepID=UPI0031DDA13C